MPTVRATSSPEADVTTGPPREATRILITRPEPGASATAARVAALGLVPLVSPVLSRRAVKPVLPRPQAITAILLTSGGAIADLPPAYHALPVLAVGDATAARAQAAGFRDVASAGGGADDLVRLASMRLPRDARPLLLPVGRSQGTAVADQLRAAGFRVLRRVVYAMVPARTLAAPALTALRAGQVRAVLFFSAETAQQFVRLAQRAHVADALRPVDAISIGQPAAMALQQLNWRRVRVAARPNQDEILAFLR